DVVGRPAVTRHDYGTGAAWYLSTLPSPSALARIYDDILGEAAVPRLPAAPAGIEMSRRGDTLFVINQTGERMPAPVAGHDLLLDDWNDGGALGPWATLVLDATSASSLDRSAAESVAAHSAESGALVKQD
ncbi:MAG TPA: beta-galactosidase trimerization domain-containing protein, partial [Microbacterium sp.]|uniref:beta-galactosidase trimerization domain-containing protein n=1 Tax=Microbacterium sp. TaxID=51671 RepID=UPI002B46D618